MEPELNNPILTPKQNQVIHCLQNGFVLVTDSSMNGALVSCSTHEFHINNGVFFNLVDKGLIVQGDARDHFGYKLTKLGRMCPTKPVKF